MICYSNGATPSQTSPDCFIGRSLGRRHPHQRMAGLPAWKHVFLFTVAFPLRLLQWGHALSGVETLRHRRRALPAAAVDEPSSSRPRRPQVFCGKEDRAPIALRSSGCAMRPAPSFSSAPFTRPCRLRAVCPPCSPFGIRCIDFIGLRPDIRSASWPVSTALRLVRGLRLITFAGSCAATA